MRRVGNNSITIFQPHEQRNSWWKLGVCSQLDLFSSCSCSWSPSLVRFCIFILGSIVTYHLHHDTGRESRVLQPTSPESRAPFHMCTCAYTSKHDTAATSITARRFVTSHGDIAPALGFLCGDVPSLFDKPAPPLRTRAALRRLILQAWVLTPDHLSTGQTSDEYKVSWPRLVAGQRKVMRRRISSS
ncbi:hypothetical protein LX36DRAFT_407858 [Colletotrichum falcatum]|nr:hypothetical protein LX36DRAFT_407858 [Colletotrichum falcatum]